MGRLGPRVEALRRAGPGAVLAAVHPTWLVEALADEPDETVEAVAHSLPDAELAPVLSGLAKLGRTAKGLKPRGIQAEVEGLLAARWQARVFPHAGGLGAGVLAASKELSWLASAPPDEIEHVAREIGIRAVARAFSGISREDLAKLCHGLSPNDSVRLVSAVVELCERWKPDELRPLQRVYLKLMRTGGASPALFVDTGLALLAGALLPALETRSRFSLGYRLPEPIGRRLVELSAPGAIPDEASRTAYAKDLPGWMEELQAKGMAGSYGKEAGAGTGTGSEPELDPGRETSRLQKPDGG